MATGIAPPNGGSGGNGSGNGDRHPRRKPFSTLIKRLAAFKSSAHNRSNGITQRSTDISHPAETADRHRSVPSTATGSNQVAFSDPPHNMGSPAHTRAGSIATSSHAQTYTSSTAHSSPSQSVHSLATLTTVQSTAPPSTYLPNGVSTSYNPHLSSYNPNAPPQHFTHQFNVASSSSQPGHTPSNSTQGIPSTLPHPATYSMVTQNNMLSDDASILTLASSSRKRERRRSFDTDASIRALPPSSLWGGSKESLPLSVLSGGDRATMGDRASLFADRHRDRDSVVMGTSSPLATPSHPTFGASGSSGDKAAADDDDANTDSRSIAKLSMKRASIGASLLSVPLQGPDTEPDTVK